MNQQPTDQPAIERRVIVIVPDQPGQLARVAAALAEEEVNIEAIDGRLAGEYGVITLSTSDDDAALLALLKANLRAVTSDAVVFHLPDRPGALAGVAQLFGQHGLNVRTIHILHRLEGHAIVAVTTDDDNLARTLLGNESLL
jgi:hypothetical protein